MAMHRILDAGPERGDESQRQDQLGKGEEDVGDAHQDGIDPAAGIAGDRADQQADGRGDDGHQHDHVERQPRAVDHARQDIAAKIVGAEPVLGARRQQPRAAQVADHRRIGRQHVGEGGDEQQRDDDRQAEHGQPVGGKAPPGHIGAAEPCLQCATLRPLAEQPFARELLRASTLIGARPRIEHAVEQIGQKVDAR